MKKTLLLLTALLALASAAVAQTRSGFIDGFDESKYAEITVSEEKKNCETNFDTKSDKAKEFDQKCLKSKCHVLRCDRYENIIVFFGDGDKFPVEWLGEANFPEEISLFTSLEIYYHHEVYYEKYYKKWYYRDKLDGWRVVDDIRFVGQKYIATDALRIRDAPSLSASQVWRLKEGGRATVLEVGEKAAIDGIESAWVKVRTADGTEGWCFAGYLTDGTEYREKPWL